MEDIVWLDKAASATIEAPILNDIAFSSSEYKVSQECNLIN